MALTLREEVLKNSGLLTEEILEEGFLKKALTIAAIIAALGGAAFVGPKVAKEVKQYNSVKNKPVATRYIDAATETNKNIQSKEYKNSYESTYNNAVFEKMKFVKSIKSEYNDRNNQSVLHIYIDFPFKGGSLSGEQSRLEDEVKAAFSEYMEYLNKQYSKIEEKIDKTTFNKIPLKVVYHINTSDYVKNHIELDSSRLKSVAKNYTGTNSVEVEFN